VESASGSCRNTGRTGWFGATATTATMAQGVGVEFAWIVHMAFQNRAQAALMLLERLAQYKGQHPVVLAIPRGAVPMCRIIADGLGGDLDVVLVRKLRAPHNPELAIGSIDEHGHVYIDPDIRDFWTEEYFEREKQTQLQTLRERRKRYGRAGRTVDVTGRVAIVVDDGIATGSTMIAALRAVRARHPSRLVAATAVAPGETLRAIAREADDVVCVEVPPVLYAIGMHFEDFTQVSDEEVIAALESSRNAAGVDSGG
jgi:putative phosphoribosyl transferase